MLKVSGFCFLQHPPQRIHGLHKNQQPYLPLPEFKAVDIGVMERGPDKYQQELH
jgi:hypothetical protein